MKTFSLCLITILVSGCAADALQAPHSKSQAVMSLDGPSVAAALKTAYEDTRHDCDSESKPAFLCSGVMLRGTNESQSYHSWNPVPGRAGVSFSYLRRDANFNHLAVNVDNGFIFFPILSAPVDKEHIQVLCSFPIDGNTWIREAPGCGQSTLYPVVSKRCQSQGISTATQWKAHFDAGPSGAAMESRIYSYVCSFDVRDAMNQLGAESFYQSLQAMKRVPANLLHHYNELVIQAWLQDIPERLPIQAFFYTLDSGLKGAQHDQWDFFNTTHGIFIPIIHMTLPAVTNLSAQFDYRAADQYCKPGATNCF